MEYDEVYQFVLLVLHACMIGVYCGSVTANLELELMMYRYFVHEPITRTHLSKWVLQKNYLILFIALKEYMVFAISTTPGVLCMLEKTYNWKQFSKDVTKQADAIRASLNSNAALPDTMFSLAVQIAASSKCFKCPTPPQNVQSVAESILTAIRQCSLTPFDVYMLPLRVPLYHRIHAYVKQGICIYDLVCIFQLPDDVCKLVQAAVCSNGSNASLRDIRRFKFKNLLSLLFLHELLCAFTACHNIKLIQLPKHVTEVQKQPRSVPVKYTVLVCTCCRQLREFVVDDTANNGNAWARGHHKVILDDCTGDLFCGRRAEKSSSRQSDSKATTISRSFWKTQQTHMCSYAPLLSFNILGKMLLCWGKLYMLCPSCLCVMQVRASKYSGQTIRCTHCTYNSHPTHHITCFHCHTVKEAKLQEVALQTSTVRVCSECMRSWMKMDHVTEQIDVFTAHRAINERWCNNQVMAHCACI